MAKTCSVDGCDNEGRIEKSNGKKYLRRGMCQKHYYRWFRNGDPLVDGMAKYAESRKEKYDKMIEETKDGKTCTICKEFKPLSEYYMRNGRWYYKWCKSCHADKMEAKRIEQKRNNPPTPKRVATQWGKCQGPECDNTAKTHLTNLGGPEGQFCGSHYNQWLTHRELKPLRKITKSYINDRVRKCVNCEKIKPNTEFYDRYKGGKQTLCKPCYSAKSRFDLLMRAERYEDALEIVQKMAPGQLRDRINTEVTEAMKETDNGES